MLILLIMVIRVSINILHLYDMMFMLFILQYSIQRKKKEQQTKRNDIFAFVFCFRLTDIYIHFFRNRFQRILFFLLTVICQQ